MNEREANQMLSVYASYIRAGNAKEAGELATKIVRLLAAAGMSAEGGEAKSHYEQQQWRGKLFNLMQDWHSTRDGAPSKAEAWNAIWSHVQNMGPGWRTREYLAASGEAKRGMAEANLPELPESVAHVHSNGEVCMDRRVESGVWPVELVTLKQAHDYARAYAERLAVDARRYQRLRECDPADGGPCVMTHEMNDWGRWYFLPLLGEQLDAALSNKESPNGR